MTLRDLPGPPPGTWAGAVDNVRLYARWAERGRCQQGLAPAEASALARTLCESAKRGRA